MTHILTVTHFFESHGGGIERVAAQICRRLKAGGHDARWAAGSDGDDGSAEDVLQIPLRQANLVERLTGLPLPLLSPSSTLHLWRAVEQADAVVVHDSLYLTSILAAFAARWHRKRLILIQHVAEIAFDSAWMRGLVHLLNRFVAFRLIASADQVFFVSYSTARYFGRARTRAKPQIVFNGVDTRIFRPALPGEAMTMRIRFGLPTDRKVALFVGRFIDRKGLRAIERLARDRPDIQIVMAGGGAIDPRAWGLPNVMVLGELEGERLADLYRAADVLLLPSPREAFGLVVREAMACGVPAICSTQCAAADPDGAGHVMAIDIDRLAPEATARSLGEIIDAWAVTSAQRAAMSDYAARTYDWDSMVQAVEMAAMASGVPSRGPQAFGVAS
jgi:glycosyltransferase involved in cell wall biosynthesis